MKHVNTDVFLNHYLSRRITTDAQAVVRGLTPQEDIMQAACRMSRWIDPDRPRVLTPKQSQSVNQDPKIKMLLQQRDKIERKHSPEEYKKLQRSIRNERQALRYKLRARIRREYDKKQAKSDIERQLSGEKFAEKIKVDLGRSDYQTPQHQKLIESVMSLPGSSLSEEIKRRSSAIRAVAEYCQFEEGKISKNRSQIIRKSTKMQEAIDLDELALETAREELTRERRPLICFMCYGNEKLAIKDRTQRFTSSGNVTRHFRNRHLDKLEDGVSVNCEMCSIHLQGRMELQRHAFDVHGTVS